MLVPLTSVSGRVGLSKIFWKKIACSPRISRNLDKDKLIKRIERLLFINLMSKIDEEEMNARECALWG